MEAVAAPAALMADIQIRLFNASMPVIRPSHPGLILAMSCKLSNLCRYLN